MKLVTVDEMRELERLSEAEGVSTEALMETAGLAVARVAWSSLRHLNQAPSVVALIGSGNNGGDGLVAVRHLREWGASVTAYLCASRSPDDPLISGCREAGVQIEPAEGAQDLAGLKSFLATADLALDAVLGTGRSRPIEGHLADAFAALNQERLGRDSLCVLAVDVPSGTEADSGGSDPASVVADVTVTFGCPKTGLLRLPASDRAGRVVVADIGIPPRLHAPLATEVATARWARAHLPGRPRGAHKGTFGRVMVLAGSGSYVGAAYLACVGAARSGAGYVTLATMPSLQAILATKLTEATYLLLPEVPAGSPTPRAADALRDGLQRYDVLLAGCGLGQNPAVGALVRDLLVSGPPLEAPVVLDADGLTLLAQAPDWWERLAPSTVLTPHPGEMARLLGVSIDEVEADRIATARTSATRWGVTVLLKGAYTVVASPEGQARVIPFANPALATAGTGDVLAGVVAGLVAQGLPSFDAAALGAFVHAAAAELVVQSLGDTGVVASDLLPGLPAAIKAIREGQFTGGPQELP